MHWSDIYVKEEKPSNTMMKEKCDAITNRQLPRLVKECHSFCGMVTFLSSFLKDPRKHLKSIYELQKKNN